MDPATLAILVQTVAQLTPVVISEIEKLKTTDPETAAQYVAQIQAAQAGIPTDPV